MKKTTHYVMDRNLRIIGVTRGVWHVVKRVVGYAVATVSLAIVYYLVFALLVSTDKEKALIRDNRLYSSTYADLLAQEKLLGGAIESLEAKDNAIYEEIFHAKAPQVDPLLSDGYMSASDTIPDREMVRYAAGKIASVEASGAKVEENLRRVLELCCSPGVVTPPASLPLSSLSFAQVGASTGMRVNPFYKVETLHTGIDLIAPQGDPVLAAADGTVTMVSMSAKGSGHTVEITHPGGYVTRYAHLGDVLVSRGQKVSRGRRIGTVGISGSSFAPHLHYEVVRDSTTLDPVDYFFASVSPQEYVDMKYMASRTGQSLD